MKTKRALALIILIVLAALLVLVGCGADSASTQPAQQPLDTPAPVETYTPDPLLLYAQADTSKSTAQAALATAEYFGSQLTATAQQREWEATATWSAMSLTATQQSWSATSTAASSQATATAAAQIAATSTAGAATQVALDVTATAAYANVSAYATSMAGQAEGVQLAVERERMTNQVKAIAPWVITGLAFIAVLVIGWLRFRIRVIPTGQPGDKPLLLDVVDGVVVDPDLQVNAQAGTRRQDLKALPAPSPADQAQAKLRDQAVDLATRGTGIASANSSQGQHRRTTAAGMITAGSQNQPQLPAQTRVQILPAERAAALVGDVIPAIVQDATGMDLDKENE